MTDNAKLKADCIAHWTRMLDLTVEDIQNNVEEPYAENCAFCQVYWPVITDGRRECYGCPIMEKTGQKYCKGTPYAKAVDLYVGINSYEHRRLAEFKKAVKREIKFLESLEV